jgi:hypothetical protein
MFSSCGRCRDAEQAAAIAIFGRAGRGDRHDRIDILHVARLAHVMAESIPVLIDLDAVNDVGIVDIREIAEHQRALLGLDDRPEIAKDIEHLVALAGQHGRFGHLHDRALDLVVTERDHVGEIGIDARELLLLASVGGTAESVTHRSSVITHARPLLLTPLG